MTFDYAYLIMFICGAIFGSIISIYIFTLKIKLPTITTTTGNSVPRETITAHQPSLAKVLTAETYNETIHLTELHENDLHKKIEEEQKK